VAAIWLTAKDDLFRRRIYSESRINKATAQGKVLIQKFLDRTLVYNQKMIAVISELGLKSIEVEDQQTPSELSAMILKFLTNH
jgi:hypothetical protein